MTKHRVVLALALALAAPAGLIGCDRTSSLSEQEHILRAKDFEDKGNLKGSIIELKNAIQKNPNSPQARLLLGQLYLKSRMGAEAEKELRQAQQLGISREIIAPALGEALLLTGEYQRVLDEIQPGGNMSGLNLARILQVRGDATLKLGKPGVACELYRQSLNANGSNPPTYWGLAQCSIAEHDMPKAREWLNAALKVERDLSRTWVYIGDWEQISKNSQGALSAYTSALKIEPNNLDALQKRATLKLSLDKRDEAKQDIDKVHALAPKTLPAHYLQALLLFQQKKFDAARDELQSALKLSPNHMPSILLAGTTAYELGAFQQADTYLKRFLNRYPGHAYASRFMAATQIKLNQPDRALEALSPLLSLDDKDTQALGLASDAYRLKNDPAKAAAMLEKAALVDPRNALIQTQLGFTHLTAGNTSLAIAKLQAAASLNPGEYKADSLLAVAYLNRKEWDKALAAIADLEKSLPNTAAVHNLRGNALLGKQDWTGARKSFEQALAIDPSYFPAAASLAQLDLRDRKPDAARNRFERTLEKDENNLLAMMALSSLADLNGQEQVAINWLEKAAKAHPQAIPPRAALVRHHLAKKNSQKALTLARETVNLNPDNPEAFNLLGDTQLATGNRDDAIIAFSKVTHMLPQSPDAYLRLAIAQIADQQLGNARSSLLKALQLKNDHLPSQEALIRLEMTEKKPEAALRVARNMQTQYPQLPVGHDREGDIQLAENHISQAIGAYQKALEKGAGSAGLIKLFRAEVLENPKAAELRLAGWIGQHPTDNVVRAFAAEYYMRTGRNQDAIAQYQAIDKQMPDKAIVLNNLATLYQREKDKRALPTAERALKLAPDSAASLDTLGWILLEQGQSARGLTLLDKARTKAPRNATIRYHHAAALVQTGKKALARKELEKLLAEFPKFPEAEAARHLLGQL